MCSTQTAHKETIQSHLKCRLLIVRSLSGTYRPHALSLTPSALKSLTILSMLEARGQQINTHLRQCAEPKLRTLECRPIPRWFNTPRAVWTKRKKIAATHKILSCLTQTNHVSYWRPKLISSVELTSLGAPLRACKVLSSLIVTDIMVEIRAKQLIWNWSSKKQNSNFQSGRCHWLPSTQPATVSNSITSFSPLFTHCRVWSQRWSNRISEPR